MREITIISGKGGTGKTSLTAAFASIAKNHIVCDLDVDAADLHLLLAPKQIKTERFISGNEAKIDLSICERCGKCEELCQFDAIHSSPTLKGPVVDPIRCEGCGVCVQFCPEGAIQFPSKICGEWYQSITSFSPMIHAQLFAGEENSGLLVSLLRQKAKERVQKDGLDIMLCDGSPGIGCPVIASLTGTDLAVIVTEPTPSGLHDMERVFELCKHFNVSAQVIINKYDLSSDNTYYSKNLGENNQMTQIIAIPSEGEGGLEASISGHFGHCPRYTLLTISNEKIKNIEIIPNIPHAEGSCLAPVQLLRNNNVDTLIASGMGMRPFMHFKEMQIDVYHAGEQHSVEDIIKDFLAGNLIRFDETYTCQGGQ